MIKKLAMKDKSFVKRATLTKKQSRITKGGKALELQIFGQDGTEEARLLYHKGMVLRIQSKKPRSRRLQWAAGRLLRVKNLVQPQKVNKIKKILEHDKFIKEKINEDLKLTHKAEEFGDLSLALQRRWLEIEKLQNHLGVNVLRRERLLVCSQCNAFRSGRSLTRREYKALPPSKPQRCNSCGQLLDKTKSIKCVPDLVAGYLEGVWLEDYLVTLLTREGWQAWASLYVHGSSGVPLEIDVLAIKNGYSLIAECKTLGYVGWKDVASFISKFYDIKCNYALLCSLTAIDKQALGMIRRIPGFFNISKCSSDQGIIAKLREIRTD